MGNTFTAAQAGEVGTRIGIDWETSPFDIEFSPAVDVVMAIMAIGGLLAAVGGGIYILVTVWSVFFGKPLELGGKRI